MSKRGKKTLEMPSRADLENELHREKYKKRYWQVLRNTIFTLITVAAVAVLVATLLLPVLEIYGTSMSPSLKEGDIVVSVKSADFKHGDIIAFYYNNKILCKRIIGKPGDVINIDEEGNVTVNEQLLDEPYLTEKAFGDCNIELPFQVPEKRYFVMGDHRSTSVDSRNTALGCVSEEQVVGKIVFRVWPFNSFGKMK